MRFFAVQSLPDSRTLYVGGSNTVGISPSVGYRQDWEAWLNNYKSDTVYNTMPLGGTPSWYALVRSDEIIAANPTHVSIEYAINDAMYGNAGVSARTNGWYTVMEALIVKLRTELPDAHLLMVNLAGEDAYENQTYIDSRNTWQAVCAHHGVRHVLFNDKLREIYGGLPTPEQYALYHNGAHFTELGHHTIWDAIEPQAAAMYPGSSEWSGYLADYQPYYFDDVADWLHDPILRDGTDNDGETGTWSTSGTQRSSSAATSTITWSGTFCSVALDLNTATCTFSMQIDGGDWMNFSHSSAYASIRTLWSLAYGSHTVVFRVDSGTMQIKRFLAV